MVRLAKRLTAEGMICATISWVMRYSTARDGLVVVTGVIGLLGLLIAAFWLVLFVADTGTAAADRACHRAEGERLADFSRRASAVVADAEFRPSDGCGGEDDPQLTVIAPRALRLAEVRRLFTTAGWHRAKHADPALLQSPDGRVTASFWYELGVRERLNPRTSRVSIRVQDIDFDSGHN